MNTVLLIDDDEVILSTFSMALRNAGYRVFEASTGTAGFELAKQQLPDVIISDIAMPGGSGETLLQEIRKHPDLCHKQVVLMTGQPDQAGPRRSMESGADDFLLKPIGLNSLLRCVGARLQRAQVNWRVEDRMLSQLRASLHSNLPHEFFTPLGGVLGLTEILRADMMTLTPAETKEIIIDIHHSALRLHRTLRNYLMVLDLHTTSEAVKLPKPLRPSDVADSVWSGIKAAVRRHRRRDDIRAQIDPCVVLADPLDLSLIVEELVDNACAFSAKGTPIRVGFGPDGRLSVADSGRGMLEEELRDAGTIHSPERKRAEPCGLGLGLLLVHKLAGKCGAKPVLTSRLSEGTEVGIAFIKPIPLGPTG
jgi:signal transduction histidine kinase